MARPGFGGPESRAKTPGSASSGAEQSPKGTPGEANRTGLGEWGLIARRAAWILGGMVRLQAQDSGLIFALDLSSRCAERFCREQQDAACPRPTQQGIGHRATLIEVTESAQCVEQAAEPTGMHPSTATTAMIHRIRESLKRSATVCTYCAPRTVNAAVGGR